MITTSPRYATHNYLDTSAVKTLLAPALLLLLLIVMLSRFLLVWPTPLIFPNTTLQYGTDLVRESWSVFRFTNDTIHAYGQFPLWRPYLLSGAPLIGHPVAPVMYPPNWLTLILPLPTAFNLLILFHLWWAGVGTYVYLRSIGLRVESSFLGACAFALTPRIFSHIGGGHFPLIEALGWWPWAWFAFSQYRRTLRLQWALLLGIALAALALTDGRYLVMSGCILTVCSVWTLVRSRGAEWRHLLVMWAIAGVLLVGLAATEVGPLAELLPLTNRGALKFEALDGGLDVVFLLNIVFRSSIVAPESYVYFGVTLLPLLLYDLVNRAKKTRFWWYAAIAFIVLNLGTNTPVYGLLLRIPIFDFFRAPERWYPFAVFAVAIIAALSLDQWLSRHGDNRRLAPVLVGLGLAYVAVSLGSLVGFHLPFMFFPQVVLLPIAILIIMRGRHVWQARLLILLLIIDIGWTNWELVVPASESAIITPDPLTAFLIQTVRNDERVFAPYGGFSEPSAIVDHVHTADGYDPFILRSYEAFSRTSIHCDFTDFVVAAPPTRASAIAAKACAPPELDRPLLSLLDVHYVILPSDQNVPDVPLVFHGDKFQVYDIGAGNGRAFGVTKWVNAPPDGVSQENCIQALQALDSSKSAIVDTPSVQQNDLGSLEIKEHHYIANGEHFTVQASESALMIRSEVIAPGWHATVDNKPVDVMRADCTLQGIFVPAGTHEIEFHYMPSIYPVAIVAALVTLLALAIVGMVALIRQRRAS